MEGGWPGVRSTRQDGAWGAVCLPGHRPCFAAPFKKQKKESGMGLSGGLSFLTNMGRVSWSFKKIPEMFGESQVLINASPSLIPPEMF